MAGPVSASAERVTLVECPEAAEADLASIYGDVAPMVRRLCCLYLGNVSDAEDATQETFVRLNRRIDSLTGDPRWYAFRIARNVCCEELTRRRRSTVAAARWAGGMTDQTEHELARSESRDLLRRVRDRLSPEELQVFKAVADGLSVAEIAQRLGVNESALGVRLCRARKRMRAIFGTAAAVAGVIAGLGRWPRRLFAGRPRASLALMGAPATLASMVVIGSFSFAVLYWHGDLQPNAVVPFSGESLRGAAAAGPSPVHPTVAPAPIAEAAGGGGPRSSGHAPSAGGLATSFTDPSTTATIGTTGFTSIVASPDYSNDHTVFASGSSTQACGNPALCFVLFRSTDGGATWTGLKASRFGGGTILLPPSFPADGTIFAAGALGLQRSDDGGASFHVVVPGAAPAAVSPQSTRGDTRIVVGLDPLVVYDSTTGSITPGPVLPAGLTSVDSLAYAGSGSVLFVAAEKIDPVAAASGSVTSAVVRCAVSAGCATVASAVTSGLELVPSPAYDIDHTLVAYAGSVMLRSQDGGATFTGVPSPAGTTWRVFAPAGRGSPGTAFAFSQAARGGRLLLTQDGATSFGAVAPGLAAGDLLTVLNVLPDGTMLGSGLTGSGGTLGLECSIDQGQHWSSTC